VTVELRVRGLRAGYGPVEVLHGLDLDVPAGRVTAVLGPNGAGKTTLLRTLAGLINPSAGTVRWHGRDVTGRLAYRRARDGMLLVPDEGGVFADLTVADNVAVFAGSRPAETAFAAVVEAFPVLGQRREQLAGTLSGGEQQMLALSRALARPFRLLLIDELSRGLAAPVIGRLYRVLAGLAESSDAAIVLVEQDSAAVLHIAQVVYVLSRGAVVFAGEPADLPSGGRPGYALSSGSGTS
jgi:branched-chain amino acid transport system ATP-binding protein